VKQGIIIPVYNHGGAVGAVVDNLKMYGLPIVLVDDGSLAETKESLALLAASCPLVALVTLAKNRGKGGAVMAGFEKARELGCTHVLQIDADGQHDARRAGFFLAESAAHPDAAICACPEYDESAPASRRNGRKIANVWAKIVTLSSAVVDTMIGFRVYPLEKVRAICHSHYLDPRMGFDVEILIRLYWKNVPLRYYPVKVLYPAGGISNFHIFWDNARISLVFTRLFFGMLLRAPLLISRRFRPKTEGEHAR
jgi:glycosyltransferase involved in cell wall biosynthesis